MEHHVIPKIISTNNCKLSRFLLASVAVATDLLLSLVKISFIVGSKVSFFAATNLVSPLVGQVGGMGAGIYVYVIRTLCKVLFLSSISLYSLLYHIPSLLGSIYSCHTRYESNFISRLAMTISCLACIVFFCLHPVGGQAWSYSMFWLIPAFLAHYKHRSIFVHSLANTLVAHAVGSVLWIYTHESTPALWLGLIPIVCIERGLFASGATLIYTSCKMGVSLAGARAHYQVKSIIN